MLSYLQTAGMADSFAALAREADMADFDPSDPKDKYSGLLEKKWTSVIRLQKKACRLLSAWL